MPRSLWTKRFWTGSLLGLTPDAERRWRRRTLIVLAWLCIGAVVNVLVAWGCVWYGESRKRIHTVVISREPQYPYQWIEMDWPGLMPSSWPRPTQRVSRSSKGYQHDFARNIVWMNQITREEPTGDGVPGSIQENRRKMFIERNLPVFERSTGVAEHSGSFDPYLIEDPAIDGFMVKYESRKILRECFLAKAGWPCPSFQSSATQSFVSGIGNYYFTGQVGNGPHMDTTNTRCTADILDGGIMADSVLPTSVSGPRTWTFPIMPLWTGFAINTLLYASIGWSIVRAFLSSLWFTIRRRRRRRGLCVACAYPVRGLSVCPECGTADGSSRRASLREAQ